MTAGLDSSGLGGHGPHEACERCADRLCTLADARRGERLLVLAIDDDLARMHALRFGVGEGAFVHCVTRIPAGPIVLAHGRQELAFGRGLAKRIRVRREGVAQ